MQRSNRKRGTGAGRGWHGNSAGHAKAGAMGGRARKRRRKNNEENT